MDIKEQNEAQSPRLELRITEGTEQHSMQTHCDWQRTSSFRRVSVNKKEKVPILMALNFLIVGTVLPRGNERV